MEQIKFTEEEMTELRTNQQKFNDLIVKLGQLQIDKINNTNQAKELENISTQLSDKFIELKVLDKEISDKLSAKYGDGILNPETGVFTPTKADEPSNVTEINKQ